MNKMFNLFVFANLLAVVSANKAFDPSSFDFCIDSIGATTTCFSSKDGIKQFGTITKTYVIDNCVRLNNETTCNYFGEYTAMTCGYGEIFNPYASACVNPVWSDFNGTIYSDKIKAPASTRHLLNGTVCKEPTSYMFVDCRPSMTKYVGIKVVIRPLTEMYSTRLTPEDIPEIEQIVVNQFKDIEPSNRNADLISEEYPCVEPYVRDRIVNGEETNLPYVAELRRAGKAVCSGILIANSPSRAVFASAAHCGSGIDTICLPKDASSVCHAVQKFIPKGDYNPEGKINDFALYLTRSFVDVSPICLHLDKRCDDGKEYEVCGYGSTAFGQVDTGTQRCTSLSKVNCYTLYAKHDSNVCLLGDDTDSCSGDSGGPIFCPYDDNTGYMWTSVVVAGVKCNSGIQGLNYNVAYARSFIEEKTTEEYDFVIPDLVVVKDDNFDYRDFMPILVTDYDSTNSLLSIDTEAVIVQSFDLSIGVDYEGSLGEPVPILNEYDCMVSSDTTRVVYYNIENNGSYCSELFDVGYTQTWNQSYDAKIFTVVENIPKETTNYDRVLSCSLGNVPLSSIKNLEVPHIGEPTSFGKMNFYQDNGLTDYQLLYRHVETKYLVVTKNAVTLLLVSKTADKYVVPKTIKSGGPTQCTSNNGIGHANAFVSLTYTPTGMANGMAITNKQSFDEVGVNIGSVEYVTKFVNTYSAIKSTVMAKIPKYGYCKSLVENAQKEVFYDGFTKFNRIAFNPNSNVAMCYAKYLAVSQRCVDGLCVIQDPLPDDAVPTMYIDNNTIHVYKEATTVEFETNSVTYRQITNATGVYLFVIDQNRDTSVVSKVKRLSVADVVLITSGIVVILFAFYSVILHCSKAYNVCFCLPKCITKRICCCFKTRYFSMDDALLRALLDLPTATVGSKVKFIDNKDYVRLLKANNYTQKYVIAMLDRVVSASLETGSSRTQKLMDIRSAIDTYTQTRTTSEADDLHID